MDVVLLRLGLASKPSAYRVLLATYSRIIGRVELDNPVHGGYLAGVSEISDIMKAFYNLRLDPELQHLCKSVFPWMNYRIQKRYLYAETVRLYWVIARK